MLYISQNHKLVFIWKEISNSWEKVSLPNQMKLARIDPTNWRLYWANSAKIRGIHSSDVRGNNRKTLVTGQVIVVLVSTTAMHIYSGYKEDIFLFNDALNTFCLRLYGVRHNGKGPLR